MRIHKRKFKEGLPYTSLLFGGEYLVHTFSLSISFSRSA